MFLKLRNNTILLPVIFSIALTYWALSAFFGNNSLIETVILVSGINCILFACFYSMRKRQAVGFIIFITCSLLYFIIAFLIASSHGMASYLVWIATTKSTSGNLYFSYWVATIMFACYGFSYPVFYFAVVRFRIFFLLMIGMISFLLQSAKNQSELSVTFYIYAIMFFILYIDQWKRKNTRKTYESKGSTKWYRSSIVLFMILVIGIAFIIPKPGRIPQIAYLDAVISQAIRPLGAAVQNAAQGQSSETSFAVRSSSQRHLNSYNAPLGDRVLFEVEAKEPLYLVLQSFDHYEKNNWMKLNSELQKMHYFEYFNPRYEKLDAIWDVNGTMKVFGYKDIESVVPSMLKLPSIPTKRSKAVVVYKEYPLALCLSTLGVTGIESANKTVLMSESAQCSVLSKGIPQVKGEYTISYISQQLGPATREFNLIKRLSGDDVEKLLRDIYKNESNKLNDEELKILKSSIAEMNIADENYLQLPANMPKRIYDLSKNITSGLKSDYDKANAIVEFLHGSEFSYELKQPDPPVGVDYNDFFLFQSKKGICIHFASAMTVLARAAGLPTRYVEGFSATEYDSSSRKYIVREKDAHAFPEVYIKGYGWMVFEPTPSTTAVDNNLFAFLISVVNVFKSAAAYVNALPVWIKIMFVPYILFVFFFVVWAFIKIRKRAWKGYLKKSDKGHAVGVVLERIAALMGKINMKMERYETPAAYAKRVYDESGIDLIHLSEVYNRSRYGEIEPEAEDVDTALRLYGEVSVYVRKKVGRLRRLLF